MPRKLNSTMSDNYSTNKTTQEVLILPIFTFRKKMVSDFLSRPYGYL